MINAFINSASDAFSNPDSPLYYVIGSLFLVLLIGALAVYFVISKKREKKADDGQTGENGSADASADDRSDVDGQESADAETTDDGGNKNNIVDGDNNINAESADGENADGKEKEAETQNDAADGNNDPVATANEESRSEPNERAAAQESEASEQPAAEPEQRSATDGVADERDGQHAEPSQKKEKTGAQQKTSKKPAAKKQPAKKPAGKPFIDRVIGATSVHGIYNELKNTLMSYPGIKAKLTKEREEFYFGTDKKAAIELDGGIVLYLSVDPENMPSQFNVDKADGDLPTTLRVSESKIDSAQKAIVFAMNVSLLTRSDRTRFTDYVQKAVNAKERAKKK